MPTDLPPPLPTPDSTAAPGVYNGKGREIFNLVFKTGLLTIITFGIYRFWAKTRIRKYVWSSTELERSAFEYTGTGREKFLGFLLAVVILAVYLGIIQTLLFFFGFAFYADPQSVEQAIAQAVSVYISVLAVLPLYFFAVYRARRYRMARTRWRGIRFGMEKGAWGYVLRALGYGFLTIVSLGLLLPLATFRLEKYMTDRSWFGDARFVQEGRWQDLYGAMKHLFIAVGIGLGALGLMSIGEGTLSVLGVIVAPFYLLVGYVIYSVNSFAYLARHKVLDGRIRFEAAPRPGKVIGTYVKGGLALFGLILAISAMSGGIVFLLATSVGGADVAAGSVPMALQFVPLLIFLGIFALGNAVAYAMIHQPILAHFVTTLEISDPNALADIHQRASDTGADAEGFADALDVGGAF